MAAKTVFMRQSVSSEDFFEHGEARRKLAAKTPLKGQDIAEDIQTDFYYEYRTDLKEDAISTVNTLSQ